MSLSLQKNGFNASFHS